MEIQNGNSTSNVSYYCCSQYKSLIGGVAGIIIIGIGLALQKYLGLGAMYAYGTMGMGAVMTLISLISTCKNTKPIEANLLKREATADQEVHIKSEIKPLQVEKAQVESDTHALETPLLEALRRQDNDAAKQLIADNPTDVNVAGTLGETPLHVAVKNGNTEIIALLLDKGGDVNASDPLGNTPLHRASTPEVAQLLLGKGALFKTNQSSFSPLHVCFPNSLRQSDIYNRLKTLSLLLDCDHRIDINFPSVFEHFVLGYNQFRRAEKGEGIDGVVFQNLVLEIFDKLLHQNAYVTWASLNSWIRPLPDDFFGEIYERFLGYLHKQEEDARTALYQKSMEVLSDPKGDVNHANYEGDTPLHLARTVDEVRALITRGASLHQKNRKEQSPLEAQLLNDNAETAMVRCFLEEVVKASDLEILCRDKRSLLSNLLEAQQIIMKTDFIKATALLYAGIKVSENDVRIFFAVCNIWSDYEKESPQASLSDPSTLSPRLLQAVKFLQVLLQRNQLDGLNLIESIKNGMGKLNGSWKSFLSEVVDSWKTLPEIEVGEVGELVPNLIKKQQERMLKS